MIPSFGQGVSGVQVSRSPVSPVGVRQGAFDLDGQARANWVNLVSVGGGMRAEIPSNYRSLELPNAVSNRRQSIICAHLVTTSSKFA